MLRDDEPDWVNTVFLSTRFRAWRVGGYNEYLYTFFKCLTDERIAYADGWFAEAHDDSASITLDGWEIQRRCPHLKADLSKFGVVDGTTLTCNLHGWSWNLTNGRCLTSKGHELRSAKRDHRSELRRRSRPAGSPRHHVAPLPLSLGHLEGDPAADGSRIPHRAAGLVLNRFRIWGGSSDLRRWLPPGRLAADQVDAGDSRRAGHRPPAPPPSTRSPRPTEFTAVLDQLLER